MAANPNFDSLLSTTLDNYRKTIEDNIFNATPLLYWLKQKNRKTVLNGGAKIIIPLMYEKNSTVKSYSGYDPLDVTPQEGISAAEYEWKQIAGSITVSRSEERKNSGESQVINLLDSKIRQAELSLEDTLSTMLFSDGTGNGGKDLMGLAALLKDTPTTGSVGGISRATNTWWRNQYTTGTKTTTAYDNLLAAMRTVYNRSSKGSDHPDLILSDRDTFEGYESLLVTNERFQDQKTGDAGFENLKFKGATVLWDPACPGSTSDGRMYFLNSKYLSWVVDEQTDFTITPFVRPKDQDAKTAQILFMGNFVASNLQRQGVITAIS